MAKSPDEANDKSPRSLAEAAALALEETKQKATTSNKFIYNNQEKEIIKGNQRSPGGWLHGPAHLEMFKAGYDRLVRVSNMSGNPRKSVQFVRAARLKGTKKIYVWPVEADTLDAIEVTGTHRSAWINLISLLESDSFVATGRRERYALNLTGDGPEGPAVVMDLGRPLESRVDPKRKKSSKSVADKTDDKASGKTDSEASGKTDEQTGDSTAE